MKKLIRDVQIIYQILAVVDEDINNFYELFQTYKIDIAMQTSIRSSAYCFKFYGITLHKIVVNALVAQNSILSNCEYRCCYNHLLVCEEHCNAHHMISLFHMCSVEFSVEQQQPNSSPIKILEMVHRECVNLVAMVIAVNLIGKFHREKKNLPLKCHIP